jgi:hypothetical protein
MLIGELEGYDEATTDFGTYTVAHVRNEEGVLKGLWLMHSVLQDEWKEAAPEVGERVGAIYHGKRSGENFDYHMWTVKVDRSTTKEDRSETEEKSQVAAGSDRPPQESERDPKSGAEGGAKETAPGFDGSDLYGEPASKQSAADAEGETPEDAGGESTLDDPNGGLPF